MSGDTRPATIDVNVRFQTAHEPDVDVELGAHERDKALRLARYLAAFYGGHVDGIADSASTGVVAAVVPPRHTASPGAVRQMQRVATIRKTLLVTEPGTAQYDSLTRELFHCQPVAHRPLPRPSSTEQQGITDDTSPS